MHREFTWERWGNFGINTSFININLTIIDLTTWTVLLCKHPTNRYGRKERKVLASLRLVECFLQKVIASPYPALLNLAIMESCFQSRLSPGYLILMLSCFFKKFYVRCSFFNAASYLAQHFSLGMHVWSIKSIPHFFGINLYFLPLFYVNIVFISISTDTLRQLMSL